MRNKKRQACWHGKTAAFRAWPKTSLPRVCRPELRKYMDLQWHCMLCRVVKLTRLANSIMTKLLITRPMLLLGNRNQTLVMRNICWQVVALWESKRGQKAETTLAGSQLGLCQSCISSAVRLLLISSCFSSDKRSSITWVFFWKEFCSVRSMSCLMASMVFATC